MAPPRAFGQTPRRKVRVRIQATEGARVETTKSFVVYGHDQADVERVVEHALEAEFGDDDEEQDEVVPTRTIRRPVVTIKKKRA